MRSSRVLLTCALAIGLGVSGSACSDAGSDSGAAIHALEAAADTVDGVARLTYPEAGPLPSRGDSTRPP